MQGFLGAKSGRLQASVVAAMEVAIVRQMFTKLRVRENRGPWSRLRVAHRWGQPPGLESWAPVFCRCCLLALVSKRAGTARCRVQDLTPGTVHKCYSR